ncbi:MAG: amidohydrolase [Bacteroidaceae bacterium]|nr:amidohydrolase [Bacteroidaceae bacterium]
MPMTIIDAHSHLWLRQDTKVDGKTIKTLTNGRSIFLDEEVQMIPPFMIDGVNSAEVFLSNMNYAQVGGAVVVQEIIDGNQNEYLKEVQAKYADRFFTMGMTEFRYGADFMAGAQAVADAGFRGLAIPGHRLLSVPTSESEKEFVTLHLNSPELMEMFKMLEQKGMILSMCLGDDEAQIREMAEVIQECPDLKVAIGHFGMVTTPSFESQVKLALEGKNVMIESGGITWLYNSEFYPYPSAIKSIKQAADWVGMERLMWGSDYPRTITAITYKMSYDFITKSKELSEADKAKFLGENAVQFYGFKNLPELPYIKNMSE